jgi:ABC-type glycerol-3-phosphate transport system substrate-binding protein
MKLRAPLICVLVGTMAVATACGDDSDSGDSTAESGNETDSGSGNEADGEVSGEVTLWMYPVIRDEAVGKEFWEQVESDFEAANENIDLTIELGTFEQRDAQISAALAAGTGPDLVMIIPDQIATYRGVDGLLPVTDAIADERDAFAPAGLDVVDYDGELFGVPLFQNANTVAYNTAAFEQAGIDELPTTWDEVREAAEILAENGIAVMDYAGNPEVTLNVTFYPILWQAGGHVFTEDGSDIAFDSPEGVEALEFLLELQEMGGLPPEAATKSNGVEGSPLAEGEVAMRVMTNANELGQMRAALGEENVALGEPLTGAEQVTFANPGMLSLTSINEEANREAAYEVIRYLTSPDAQTALNQASGTFPTRTDVPPPSDDADGQAMSAALEHAFAGEAHPQARPVMATLAPFLQSALQGNMTAEEALTAAAEEARNLLARS